MAGPARPAACACLRAGSSAPPPSLRRRFVPPLPGVRSPPGLKRLARRRPALPVGVFAALRAASARSRSCARSRVAVLGRARPPLPRWRLPPGLGALRRACARPPRPSGALRAARGPPRACCAALAGRSCPLRPGPPCRRAGAVLRGLGRGSPGGGSRPAARASGGCVPRPRRAGVWRAAARRPAAASGQHARVVLAGKCKMGLDTLHKP